MIATKELSSHLATLYAAPLEPKTWQVFLACLSILTDTASGYMVSIRPEEGHVTFAGGGINSNLQGIKRGVARKTILFQSTRAKSWSRIFMLLLLGFAPQWRICQAQFLIPNAPFIAMKTTTSSKDTGVETETGMVARKSDGSLYWEIGVKDGKGGSVIIIDVARHRSITLLTSQRLFLVTVDPGIKAVDKPPDTVRPPPSVMQTVQLGHRMIEGIDTVGFSETTSGGITFERWYSPTLDLSLVLDKHLPGASAPTRIRFTQIHLDEPSDQLFEIPAGYKELKVKVPPTKKDTDAISPTDKISAAPENEASSDILGITVSDLSPATTTKAGMRVGVVVTSVRPGSFADRIGLTSGEIIKAINGDTVFSETDYRAIVSSLKSKSDVVLMIQSPAQKHLDAYIGGTLP